MGIQLKNNAYSTLASSITASNTGIVVATNEGSRFPTLGATDYFYATLESTGGTTEIVKVTARSGDTMTIVRAQESTSAQSFLAGSRIELRVTASSVNDFVNQNAELGVYTPSSANAVTRTIQNKLRDIVSVQDYGTGSTAIDNAFLVSDSVDVNTDITLTANVTIPSGGRLFSSNRSTITTAGYRINLTNNDSTLDNILMNCTSDGVTPLTCVNMAGVGNTVKNCKFYNNTNGVFYSLAVGSANRAQVLNNEFTGTPSQALCAVFGSFNFLVSGNKFYNIGLAFNFITRDSGRGIIEANSFKDSPNNPLFIDTASRDIVVNANTIDNCGDSGILIGNDAAGDYCRGITITNNVVSRCPDAGIGAADRGFFVTVANNVIRNCGNGGTRIYDTGILVYGDSWSVTGNTIINDSGYNYTSYGIVILPQVPIYGATLQDTAYVVTGNSYSGIQIENIHIKATSGNLYDKIDIKEGSTSEYPVTLNFNAWTGALPTNVAGLTTYVLAGVGITNSEETTKVISGSSLKVVATTNEGGVDLTLVALNQFKNPCILEVTGYVLADSASDSGKVALNTTCGGSNQMTTVAFASNTTWKPVTLRMAVSLTTQAVIRFYADAGKTVYFDQFEVKAVNYNC